MLNSGSPFLRRELTSSGAACAASSSRRLNPTVASSTRKISNPSSLILAMTWAIWSDSESDPLMASPRSFMSCFRRAFTENSSVSDLENIESFFFDLGDDLGDLVRLGKRPVDGLSQVFHELFQASVHGKLLCFYWMRAGKLPFYSLQRYADFRATINLNGRNFQRQKRPAKRCKERPLAERDLCRQ